MTFLLDYRYVPDMCISQCSVVRI